MQSKRIQILYLLPKVTGSLLRNQGFYEPVNRFKSVYTTSIVNKKCYGTFASIYKWIKAPAKTHKFVYSGTLLYENIVDGLDYNYFFKQFKMEDTFFSWFLITELHVWMLMLRTMQESEDGLKLRNSIVEAMWNDVNVRAKKLGPVNTSLFKAQVQVLSEQFNASIIGYDEAIVSNDTYLAGHLWRRFFKCENNNPEDLEKLIHYIRKQVNNLGSISSTEMFADSPMIEWKYV